MIPKKTSVKKALKSEDIASAQLQKALEKARIKTKNPTLSINSFRSYLRNQAEINSRKKPNSAKPTDRYSERTLRGSQLKNARRRDANRGDWGTSFNPDLATLSKSFGLNLVDFIKKISNTKIVAASIGCGSGRAESQLKTALGNKVELHATGVKLLEQWTQHKNYKSINWHVTHGNALTRVFKPESLDFVFSRLGIHHAQETYTQRNKLAFKELAKILKKGGKVLIDMEGAFFEEDIPRNLRIVSNEVRRKPDFYGKGQSYVHRVLLLEKI